MGKGWVSWLQFRAEGQKTLGRVRRTLLSGTGPEGNWPASIMGFSLTRHKDCRHPTLGLCQAKLPTLYILPFLDNRLVPRLIPAMVRDRGASSRAELLPGCGHRVAKFSFSFFFFFNYFLGPNGPVVLQAPGFHMGAG